MYNDQDFYVNEDPSVSRFWAEKVCVITEDFEIIGYVFMPKTGKRERVLTDILNGEKRFVAIKDANITPRRGSNSNPEKHDYIQINIDSIVLIRPIREN